MHVGIVSEHSDPARGGAESYLAALEGRLLAHGHRVTLLAGRGPRAHPVARTPGALRPLHYARTFLPLLREARAGVVLATVPLPGCDFYQPHTGILPAAMPPRHEPLAQPWRFLRSANPLRRLHFALLNRFERQTLAPPARLLALSPRIVADAERFCPGTRAVLLRPGVDLAHFRPGEGGPVGSRLLFVATNFRLKGLATAVRALAFLPQAHLVVVGDGRRIPHPRVRYAGSVPDVAPLYRQADVLVHPTWYDTAAQVVLEALASGVPAVTTVRDGNADLAVEGGGAAIDDPRDAAGLARAVEEVLGRRNVARARAVAERFPAEAMLDRVVEVLTCAS